MAGGHVGQVLQHPEREQLGHHHLAPVVEVELPLDDATAIRAGQFVQLAGNQAGPKTTPNRSGATGRSRSPASTHARSAAAKANWMSRLITFKLFRAGRTVSGRNRKPRRRSARERRGVEQVEAADAASALNQRGPIRFLSDADGADHAQAGHDDCLIGRHAATWSKGNNDSEPLIVT